MKTMKTINTIKRGAAILVATAILGAGFAPRVEAVEGANGSRATATGPYVVAVNPWTYEVRTAVWAARAWIYLKANGYTRAFAYAESATTTNFRMVVPCRVQQTLVRWETFARVEGVPGEHRIAGPRYVGCA